MAGGDSSGDDLVIIGVTQIKKEPDVVEIRDDDDISELEHLRKLFIGGLAPYTTEATLRAYYEKWGKVVDVIVMRDSVSKRSRGFGFVTYVKAASVNLAQENRPHIIDGKTVEAKRALQRQERESKDVSLSVKKLFVGGLKEIHNEENLKEYFSSFGNVVSVKLLTDKTTGNRRGFAFVEFDDYDPVDKAILQKTHTVQHIAVDVKKSVYSQELKNRQNRMDNGIANGNKFNNFGNPKTVVPTAIPMSRGYQMPKPNHPMPYPAPPQPMNGIPQGPPPNFNYWGPPPPQMHPPPYGCQQPPPYGYQQAPPPMNNWNCPPGPNNWNGYPPSAPANWQPNQWGYGPPPNATAPVAWNPTPVPPMQQVPPPGVPVAATPQGNQGPPPAQGPPPNFGTGYQQNYGGGPMKQNNATSNRPNPYGAPPMNAYGNSKSIAPQYGGKPMQSATPVPPVGGGYRR